MMTPIKELELNGYAIGNFSKKIVIKNPITQVSLLGRIFWKTSSTLQPETYVHLRTNPILKTLCFTFKNQNRAATYSL
jgi:hypothetical protein